jgi:hypothetical protein
VALETTFRALSTHLHKLNDALDDLNLMLGDKPVHVGSALADGMEASVLDLMGRLHEARATAVNARRAVTAPMDLDRARRALTVSQDRVLGIEKQFAYDLASYEKLTDLIQLGNERGDEWLAWAGSAKQSIDACRQPMAEVSRAVARCWQEIAEHAGATSISVRTNNTSIGQRIVPRAEEPTDLGYERIT